ncbi:hypothetical protein AQPW35_39900 [Rubrivivax pictus]|uniref:Lipocalin/cytosolic fatty-acid binding domain-containing protein n=1 Tax=Pseudaquabacterium pictum TaxID=2315236 RepID=A0A480AT87_9BURK|nr:hypothetical protein AQPW35_39900 [Rubrivivax pictus]
MADSSLPHSPPAAVWPSSAPDGDIDLDIRIRRMEEQLVAREQRVRSRVQDLGMRARKATAPSALLLKLAAVAAAGGALVWGLQRRHHPTAPLRPRGPAAQAAGPAALLLSLLPMAWPMLPARWRQRVSLATAVTVVGVAVPLLQRLMAGRSDHAATGERPAPATVAHLDLVRFVGTWHEQARLPQPFEHGCAAPSRVSYTPQGGLLGVRNECRNAKGRLRSTDGVARVVPGSGGARLEVSFLPAWLRWLPLAWADRWVLHVDEAAANYRVAIVGHPSRRGLWLLSRSPHLPADELQRLVALANGVGYDTSRLLPLCRAHKAP